MWSRLLLLLTAFSLAAGGWKPLKRAPPTEEVILRVALHRSNGDALSKHLLAVSDPGSPFYGKHYSREQIRELFAPPLSATAALDAWLRSADGIRSVEWSPNWDYVTVATTVQGVETLLNTTVLTWELEDEDDSEEAVQRGSLSGLVRREDEEEGEEEEAEQAVATALQGEHLLSLLPSNVAPFVAYLTGVAELPSVAVRRAARRRAAARLHALLALPQDSEEAPNDGWERVVAKVQKSRAKDPYLDKRRTTEPVIVGFGGNRSATFSLPLLCPEMASSLSSFGEFPFISESIVTSTDGEGEEGSSDDWRRERSGEARLKSEWFCVNGLPRTLASAQAASTVATDMPSSLTVGTPAASDSGDGTVETATDASSSSRRHPRHIMLHLAGLRIAYTARLPADPDEPLTQEMIKFLPSSAFTCHKHPSKHHRWPRIDSFPYSNAPHCVVTVKGLENFLPYAFRFEIVWTPVHSAVEAAAAEEEAAKRHIDGVMSDGKESQQQQQRDASGEAEQSKSATSPTTAQSKEAYFVRLEYPLLIVPDMRKTPEFVKEFYGVPKEFRATHPWNRQAVASMYLNPEARGYYDPSDLKRFYDKIGIPRENAQLVQLRGGGRNKPHRADDETQLDIQWITAMAPGVKSYVWRSRNDRSDPFEELFEGLQRLEHPPLVFSISYDGEETDYHPRKLKHISEALQILGLQGVTVLVSSGDAGAWGSGGKCGKLKAYFPASSPWVLSVGATQLMAQSVDTKDRPTEVACSIATGALITSGGGFSNYLEQPWYQREAVSEYLNAERKRRGKEKRKHTELGETSELREDDWESVEYYGISMAQMEKTRGYPDISIFGHNYFVMDGGKGISVDGTSASAPALAGILTLYNDQRLNAGLPPLGFVNPLLYRLSRLLPNAFNRVTRGDGKCQMDGICCLTGFTTNEAAWNPVTGLGSPRFDIIGPYLTGEKSIADLEASLSASSSSSAAKDSSQPQKEGDDTAASLKEHESTTGTAPFTPPAFSFFPTLLYWLLAASGVLGVLLTVRWLLCLRRPQPSTAPFLYNVRWDYQPVPTAADYDDLESHLPLAGYGSVETANRPRNETGSE